MFGIFVRKSALYELQADIAFADCRIKDLRTKLWKMRQTQELLMLKLGVVEVKIPSHTELRETEKGFPNAKT